mmetsp:Transcript_48724/g.104014  ORF Transcript_48724/g.104014 Transcript_48724/m.104014 type:complete len:452 (-) Transcript_48724:138-1493(-)
MLGLGNSAPSAAGTPPNTKEALGEGCLRAPTFLGVHTLVLRESKSLDGGGLRIWVAAAVHATAEGSIVPLAQRSSAPAGGVGGVFAAVSDGSSRQVSGAYLRAALQKCATSSPSTNEFVHVWLPLPGTAKETVDVCGASALPVRIGPYRVRVLKVELLADDTRGAQEELQQPESLLVTFAADKLRSKRTLGTQPLPGAGCEASLWLSTQATQHICFSNASTFSTNPSDSSSPRDAPLVDVEPQDWGKGALASNEVTPSAEATSLQSPLVLKSSGQPAILPQGVGSLVPTLPPLGGDGGALCSPLSGRPPQPMMPDSLELRLHVESPRIINSGVVGDAPAEEGYFGCPPSNWRVELDVMSLGTCEEHAVLPLAVDGVPMKLRAGMHELHIERVVGHYARGGTTTGLVKSDYPLLLLHVLIRVVKLKDTEAEEDESVRLGAGLERLLGMVDGT